MDSQYYARLNTLSQKSYKLGVVLYTFDLSQHLGGRKFWVWGQLNLYSKYQDSQGYIETLSQTRNKSPHPQQQQTGHFSLNSNILVIGLNAGPCSSSPLEELYQLSETMPQNKNNKRLGCTWGSTQGAKFNSQYWEWGEGRQSYHWYCHIVSAFTSLFSSLWPPCLLLYVPGSHEL